jgi:hypothetical protein
MQRIQRVPSFPAAIAKINITEAYKNFSKKFSYITEKVQYVSMDKKNEILMEYSIPNKKVIFKINHNNVICEHHNINSVEIIKQISYTQASDELLKLVS